MWGFYQNLVSPQSVFSSLLSIAAVKEYFVGADNFIFWQHIGNCSFLLHLLNNTPMHEILHGSRGDLLWIALVLFMSYLLKML